MLWIWKIQLGIAAALVAALALQTWRLSNVRDDLALIEARFGTCKADYSKVLEDVRDDAAIDSSTLEELRNPDWFFDPADGGVMP